MARAPATLYLRLLLLVHCLTATKSVVETLMILTSLAEPARENCTTYSEFCRYLNYVPKR